MQKLTQIYFRADGNAEIGLGHITRSLALADMLKDNFEIFVMIQNPAEAVKKQIQEITENIIELPKTENYQQEAGYIAEKYLKGDEIVVLDGYNFETEYQKIIKTKAHKLVCIDDLHAWHFVADVVINHAGGVKETDYSCEPYTQLCLGLEYALLRKPFLEAAQIERKIEKIEKVFICFGGADVYNLTEKVLKICLEANLFKEIHIVVGSAYNYDENLKLLVNQEKIIFLYKNLNAQDLCDVMLRCHLAIVPASSISIECWILQLPMVVMVLTADNQKDIFNGLLRYANFYASEYNTLNKLYIKDLVLKFNPIILNNFKNRINNDKIINIFNRCK